MIRLLAFVVLVIAALMGLFGVSGDHFNYLVMAVIGLALWCLSTLFEFGPAVGTVPQRRNI